MVPECAPRAWGDKEGRLAETGGAIQTEEQHGGRPGGCAKLGPGHTLAGLGQGPGVRFSPATSHTGRGLSVFGSPTIQHPPSGL